MTVEHALSCTSYLYNVSFDLLYTENFSTKRSMLRNDKLVADLSHPTPSHYKIRARNACIVGLYGFITLSINRIYFHS